MACQPTSSIWVYHRDAAVHDSVSQPSASCVSMLGLFSFGTGLGQIAWASGILCTLCTA